MKINKRISLLLTFLFGFGTVYYSAVILGTIWFFAHVVAIIFVLLSLIEFFGKKRGFLIGLCLGLAALSRQATILGILFFLLLLPKKQNFYLLLGLVPPLLFQAIFNYLRFGNPLESGYLLQNWYSSVQADDIAKYSFFNPAYLPKHLYIMFFKGPEFINEFPYLKPDPQGMAILLTTPAFLIAFLAPIKEKIVKFSFLATFAIIIPAVFYTATGWVQFGYRYTLDFLPFLFIPLALAYSQKPTLAKTFLIFISILINILGVYWAVKLGW